jgi:hypothetical protein
MAVADDSRLANVTHVQHLPPHWGTLYELTKLPSAFFFPATDVGAVRGFRRALAGAWGDSLCSQRSNPSAPAIEAVAQCSGMLVFPGISCVCLGRFTVLG